VFIGCGVVCRFWYLSLRFFCLCWFGFCFVLPWCCPFLGWWVVLAWGVFDGMCIRWHIAQSVVGCTGVSWVKSG